MLRSTLALVTRVSSEFTFGVSRSGLFARGRSESLTELKQSLSTREFLLSKVENPKLLRVINWLYRAAAKYGSGSTADAVRHELTTGDILSKTGHIQKAIDSRQALSDLINSGRLNPEDARIAASIRADLQSALTEESWDKVYPRMRKF